MARGRNRSRIGAWRLLEKLGEGPLGEVYRARDPRDDRVVAVKVLAPKCVTASGALERLRSTASDLGRLDHPNLAAHHGLLEEAGAVLLVSEFVPGRPLSTLLQEEGPLDVERALDRLAPLLDAIEHAHARGVIHGDLKGTNVLVDERRTAKVTDAGIARALGALRAEPGGDTLETLAYAAPEQLRGEDGDARSDVYALGVLLYELLTARLPFLRHSDYEGSGGRGERRPPALRSFATDIPPCIDEAVLRALAQRPSERPASTRELRAALGLAGRGAASLVIPVHHEPVVHRLEVRAAPPRAPRRLLGWQRVAAALAAVGLLVGLNVLLFRERTAQPAAEASAPGAPPPSHGSHR